MAGPVKYILALSVLAVTQPLFVLPSHAANESTVTIQVRSTRVRKDPAVYASSIATVKYGDELKMIANEQGWLKVRAPGGQLGFVHPSAITTKEVKLSTKGEASGDVAASDVVLAGKGFDPATERQLKLSSPTLNFRAVDDMERVRVSDAELGAFIRSGSLGTH